MKFPMSAIGLGLLNASSQIRRADTPRMNIEKTAEPQPASVPDSTQALPPRSVFEPVPAWVTRLDYSKGDSASTLEEYRQAVSGEYKVLANAIAGDPAVFNQGPIMVYGENHANTLFPSIRNEEGKGAVLLESDKEEFCLPEKYQRHPDTICTHIDKGKADVKEELQSTIVKVYNAGVPLINLIDPQAIKRIDAIVGEGRNNELYMKEMLNFIQENAASFSKTASLKDAAKVDALAKEYAQAIQSYNQFTSSTIKTRDVLMINEASKIIDQMDDDAAATIIVGDAHSVAIAQALINKFPDRAVVLCRPT